MSETLKITPTRFIAGGGKLDSDKKYLTKALLSRPVCLIPRGPTIVITRYNWSYGLGGIRHYSGYSSSTIPYPDYSGPPTIPVRVGPDPDLASFPYANVQDTPEPQGYNNGSISVVITLDRPAPLDGCGIRYRTVIWGDAIQNVDYYTQDAEVMFLHGQISKTIVIYMKNAPQPVAYPVGKTFKFEIYSAYLSFLGAKTEVICRIFA